MRRRSRVQSDASSVAKNGLVRDRLRWDPSFSANRSQTALRTIGAARFALFALKSAVLRRSLPPRRLLPLAPIITPFLPPLRSFASLVGFGRKRRLNPDPPPPPLIPSTSRSPSPQTSGSPAASVPSCLRTTGSTRAYTPSWDFQRDRTRIS